METRAHHVLIGLFTLLVVGAALGFVLWLGKNQSDAEFKQFDIIFLEAVGGLSKGSTVQFNGIKVGDVVSLRLDPKDPSRVIARVRVESETPMRSDTQAQLMPAGVTGLSVIRLSSGEDFSSTPLPTGEEIPLIYATPSPFAKILAGGEDVMVNINSVLFQLRELLSSDNLHSVANTLHSLDLASATIAAERNDIMRAIRELTGASAQIKRSLADSAELIQAATGLVANSDRLISVEGGKVLSSAEQAMSSLAHTMSTLDTVVVNNADALGRGMAGLGELGPALAELRDTLASLRNITRQLESRPAEYLLDLEPMKEFTP